MLLNQNPVTLGMGVRLTDAVRSHRSEPLVEGVATSTRQDSFDMRAPLGTRLRRCCHAYETIAG